MENSVIDCERREVARRLRGLKRNGHNVTQLNHGPTWSIAWCVLGDELSACVPGDWFERMCARLADLIEPTCDRDALLAMADEMDEVAQRRRSMGYEGFAIGDEDRARRIREALATDACSSRT